MANVKVFTAEAAHAAVLEQGDKVLSIIKKKDAKPGKGGSMFLNVKFHGIEGMPKTDGWFSLKDIPISAVQDPAKKKPGQEETKPQISMKLSEAGEFGKFIMALQPIWQRKVKELGDSGAIVIGRRVVHDLLQLTISESALENAGQPLTDPIIRIKMADLGDNFPPTYPISVLQNKPKTEVMDYRTSPDGEPPYKQAAIIDESGNEVPVSFANMHKFITPGSILRRGRVSITSAAISQNWISLQITINKAVIEPGGPGGFDDEFDSAPTKPARTNMVANNNNVQTDATTPTVQTVAPVTAPAVAPTTASVQPADALDVASIINGL